MKEEDKLKLVRSKAKKLGLQGTIEISKSKNKKFTYIKPNGKKVNFGDSRYEDYLDHQDSERRRRYRARAGNILLKDGSKAVDVYESPNYLSYNLLW